MAVELCCGGCGSGDGDMVIVYIGKLSTLPTDA
jgi:hypothetical protein